MAKKPKDEKGWTGITRSPEEDIALFAMNEDARRLPLSRFIILLSMSAAILTIYLWMNNHFYPGYPIPTPFADRHEEVAAYYPPFRTGEWTAWSMTKDMLNGTLFGQGNLSQGNPVGFPVVAAPLVIFWGERGMYFTNAFILWICALVFLSLMMELVSFQLAVWLTLFMALATPNLFYASSAFPEPLGQLLLLCAVYLLIRGLSSRRDWLFYTGTGVLTGLTFFVQPILTLSIVVFGGVIMYERGALSPFDRRVGSLVGGFAIACTLFLAVTNFRTDPFATFTLAVSQSVPNNAAMGPAGTGNMLAGLWQVLLGSPQGLIFIMPVLMLLPMSLLEMWRLELRSMTMITGLLAALVIALTAAAASPLTGDSLGSRNLVAIIPFLVLPLAFLWGERPGEKRWLVGLGIMTVYMCSFGWWTGTVQGEGPFIGVLHDQAARGVLLARTGELDRPVFSSRNELEAIYFSAIESRDITRWLQTLDPDAIRDLQGLEREFFTDLADRYHTHSLPREHFIAAIDADRGIVPVIPASDPDGELTPESDDGVMDDSVEALAPDTAPATIDSR